MLTFLRRAVKARFNVLISGATGSGKTTLLNILSQSIQHHERVVTIEDAAELQLRNGHVVRLETRPPNAEGKGEVSARQLLKNALRMRPDRIILGESRGGEVLDMLQAMNTGHLGSMSTLHANSPSDALIRLEMMVTLAGFHSSETFIRKVVVSALDVIIQISRQPNGKRIITDIVEVSKIDGDKYRPILFIIMIRCLTPLSMLGNYRNDYSNNWRKHHECMVYCCRLFVCYCGDRDDATD